MGDKYYRCVKEVKKTVGPQEGRTKEQSAHAICTAKLGYKGRGKKKKLSEMIDEIMQEKR